MNILSSIIRALGIKGVAKGATVSAQATVSTVDADHNALDVTVLGTPALPADAATEAKQDTGNGFLSTLAGIVAAGKAAVTAATTAGGSATSLLASAAGVLQTQPAKGTSYSSAAAEASAVISASACSPAKWRVQNLNGATRYVHAFNASSLPGNGAVPRPMLTLTANSGGEVQFPIPTDRNSTGLVIAASSTQGTLTISATADFLINADLFASST